MKLTAVILAAGKGTRMNSSLPKVLHKAAGKPLLQHVLEIVETFNLSSINVVVSEELYEHAEFQNLREKFEFQISKQKERLGTGHALTTALKTYKNLNSPVLVVCGDTPLLTKKTIRNAIRKFEENESEIVCVGFSSKKPKGYGRLIAAEGFALEIVEEKDASLNQKKITLCNAGVYLLSAKAVKEVLPKITNNNSSGEYYLTDCIKTANQLGMGCSYVTATETEVQGVNDKEQLSKAEGIMQNRLRRKALKNGVQMLDHKSVYLSSDTKLGKDTIIHPNVIISEGVSIEEHCEILPFSHLEGCTIKAGSKIGPFARIRPKTEIGENARVGNFVEIKASKIGKNSKASHLSYVGDAEIGEDTNIGAGTIFCNYDGFSKHKTKIGKNVFIGSNSAIVAPINIADSAIIGAGSVITEDVEENSLTLARARQVNYKQKAELVRQKKRGN